uniref:Dehydrogenase/reductase X-linked n=1 Tax=Ovis aries TaxID=9940 RepID=A0AC11DIH4_SHEEP
MSPLSAARAALRVYAVGAALVVAQLLRRCVRGFVEPVFSPQPERVAIVTGGTDGIGYSTAKQLAKLGMHVIIAGNNDSKAQDVVRRIKEDTLNDQVEFLYCDLASMRSIREFVQTFKMKKLPLHVLVNNGHLELPLCLEPPRGRLESESCRLNLSAELVCGDHPSWHTPRAARELSSL